MKRKEYLNIVKEVRKEIAELGVSITINNRKVSFAYGQVFAGVHCYYDPDRSHISITVKGLASYKLKLAYLVNSLRRAMQHKTGLFAKYYDTKFETVEYMRNLILGIETEIPDLDVALEAEKDCNEFTVKYLKNRNVELNPVVRSYYPFFNCEKSSLNWFYYDANLYRLAKKEKLDTSNIKRLYANVKTI